MLWQGSALCSVQLSGPAVWDFPLYDQSRTGKVRKMHLNRWTPETAATATYPALHYGIHNNNKQQYSSLFLYDASYIRLKNLTIDYNFPKELVNKIGLQALKIYVSGENLLTFSPLKKYAKNYDPEGIYAGDADYGTNKFGSDNFGDGDGYPVMRSYSIGLSITF